MGASGRGKSGSRSSSRRSKWELGVRLNWTTVALSLLAVGLVVGVVVYIVRGRDTETNSVGGGTSTSTSTPAPVSAKAESAKGLEKGNEKWERGTGEKMTGSPKLMYKAPKGVQPGTLTVPEPRSVRVPALYDSRYGFTSNPPTAQAKVAPLPLTAGSKGYDKVNPAAGLAYRVNAVPPGAPASVGGPPRSSKPSPLFDSSSYMADWSQDRKAVVRTASKGPFAVPRHQQAFDDDPMAAIGEA